METPTDFILKIIDGQVKLIPIKRKYPPLISKEKIKELKRNKI